MLAANVKPRRGDHAVQADHRQAASEKDETTRLLFEEILSDEESTTTPSRPCSENNIQDYPTAGRTESRPAEYLSYIRTNALNPGRRVSRQTRTGFVRSSLELTAHAPGSPLHHVLNNYD